MWYPWLQRVLADEHGVYVSRKRVGETHGQVGPARGEQAWNDEHDSGMIKQLSSRGTRMLHRIRTAERWRTLILRGVTRC